MDLPPNPPPAPPPSIDIYNPPVNPETKPDDQPVPPVNSNNAPRGSPNQIASGFLNQFYNAVTGNSWWQVKSLFHQNFSYWNNCMTRNIGLDAAIRLLANSPRTNFQYNIYGAQYVKNHLKVDVAFYNWPGFNRISFYLVQNGNGQFAILGADMWCL
uniref:NTF2-like domain-containing protein n=1 Tax=Caenorhabditis japonica TaxID=281687 RepID=A0A8R1EHR3_CAEJA